MVFIPSYFSTFPQFEAQPPVVAVGVGEVVVRVQRPQAKARPVVTVVAKGDRSA